MTRESNSNAYLETIMTLKKYLIENICLKYSLVLWNYDLRVELKCIFGNHYGIKEIFDFKYSQYIP